MDMEEMKVTRFPKDFLWGSASAAYQIEGCLLYTSDAADD